MGGGEPKCEMGDSPQNNVMLVKILFWAENFFRDTCVSVQHYGRSKEEQEEQGSIIMLYGYRQGMGTHHGRWADRGEGRGQEQMGELFSREMEKEHPKLNYRSLNVTADLSYFSQCPLRPIISPFPLSSGLVSFHLISRGELFPQKKQDTSASQTGNAV